MKHDICIIGGCGHVGLPLGICFAKEGKRVVLLDVNQDAVRMVNAGTMPFREEGADELLKEVLAAGRLKAETDAALVSESEHIVFIIGTPISMHLYPTYPDFFRTLQKYIPRFRNGQHIILRSTVFPGITERVHRLCREAGLEVDVSFCPERITEGFALSELYTLPQIVSSVSPAGVRRARELFSVFTKDVVELAPMEAELAKLFTNAWRYLKFAVANQYFMIADSHGLDFYRIYDAITHNYPRMKDLAKPGFAAGPCLFKDTVQLDAFGENNFFLGHAALLVNEGLPAYLVKRMKERHDLQNMAVGILGMAFKRDSDDPRESLSFKLKNILEKDARQVFITDPYVRRDDILPLGTVIDKSDVLIVGAPHTAYEKIDLKGKPVVDIWNLYGKGAGLA